MNNNKNCLRPPFTSAGNGDDVDDTVIAVAVAVADGVVYVASPTQTYIDILMGKFEKNSTSVTYTFFSYCPHPPIFRKLAKKSS